MRCPVTTAEILTIFFLAAWSPAHAGTTLDGRWFPQLKRSIPHEKENYAQDLPNAVIIQANWSQDVADSDLGGKVVQRGWLPARLFGETTSNVVNLSFRLPKASEGELPGPNLRTATIHSRSSEDPEQIPVDGDSLKRRAIVKDGKWWWEGFLELSSEEELVNIQLKITGDEKNDALELLLVPGECWLVAGGPSVGETMPAPAEKIELSESAAEELQAQEAADKYTAARDAADKQASATDGTKQSEKSEAEKTEQKNKNKELARLEDEKNMAEQEVEKVAAEPIGYAGTAGQGTYCSFTRRGAKQVQLVSPKNLAGTMVPALGANFARALATRFNPPSEKKGGRPICVYSLSRGRKFIEDWNPAAEDNPWAALPGWKAHLLPGMRGVVWWHGEWQAEYGPVPPPPDNALAPERSPYSIHLDRFQDNYFEKGKELRGLVADHLASLPEPREEPAPPANDSILAARTLWVVVQLPGAARRTEFYDVVRQDNPQEKPFATYSAWAALRAAQFHTVDLLRGESRPMAILVPFQGAGNTAAGWVWHAKDPNGPSRFSDAGARLAIEIFANLSPGAADVVDGWPRIENWQDKQPILKFPGATRLETTKVYQEPGVDAPLLWARTSDNWERVSITPDVTPNVTLPSGTKEVRYGWADAASGFHSFKFDPKLPDPAINAEPVKHSAPRESAFVPAFQLKKPDSTPP